MRALKDYTTNEGVRMNYCAVCDHWYEKGKFIQHKLSFAHIAELKHRRSMQRWYAANGR